MHYYEKFRAEHVALQWCSFLAKLISIAHYAKYIDAAAIKLLPQSQYSTSNAFNSFYHYVD